MEAPVAGPASRALDVAHVPPPSREMASASLVPATEATRTSLPRTTTLLPAAGTTGELIRCHAPAPRTERIFAVSVHACPLLPRVTALRSPPAFAATWLERPVPCAAQLVSRTAE